jgi:hypothetical protein
MEYEVGKWYGWNGGECPVHRSSKVEAIFSDGSGAGEVVFARDYGWNGPYYPIAFRIIKEHKEPREFWISENDGYAHPTEESALSDPLTAKHGYIHVREVLPK